MDPVPLRAGARLRFTAGQVVRIIKTDVGGPLDITTIRYFYGFSVTNNDGLREVLTFQWTPEAIGGKPVTLPHIHIGPALLAGQTVMRPDDLHKAHIPTGPISLQAVIRLAITEFEVTLLRADWDEVLQRTEEFSAR